MSADQFGEIIAASEHEETVVVAEIDYSEIQLRRSNANSEVANL